MRTLWFISHPEVEIDPEVPVTQWRLTHSGRTRMERFAHALRDRDIRAVWSSSERKAVEAAEVLASALQVNAQQYGCRPERAPGLSVSAAIARG